MTRLRQMEFLVAAAEEGQITRAAHKLHVTQPALSYAIAQLERRLGVKLLERHAQASASQRLARRSWRRPGPPSRPSQKQSWRLSRWRRRPAA